jgi:hypothetical protein
VYNQFHRRLFAMKHRAVMLWTIPVAAEAVKLPPRATTRMAMGSQVVQLQPAPIVTIGVGTKVPN